MRKVFLSIVVAIVCTTCCKKTDEGSCEITMTGIAGRFKITKFEAVSYNTGAARDRTAGLSACELSGIYQFNGDGSASYTESTSCSGSGTGSWNLSNSILVTSFSSGDGNRIGSTSITNWDCRKLVVITMFPSVDSNYRYTLTRL